MARPRKKAQGTRSHGIPVRIHCTYARQMMKGLFKTYITDLNHVLIIYVYRIYVYTSARRVCTQYG